MDNSPRKSQLLNLNLLDSWFNLPYFPTSYLIASRKISIDKIKNMNNFDEHEINPQTSSKKLINFCNILSKTWLDNIYDVKINLRHSSPSLTKNLDKIIVNSMKHLKHTKNPDEIINMYNINKITNSMNINNIIIPKMKTKIKSISTTENKSSDLKKQTADIDNNSQDKIETSTKYETESMEIPAKKAFLQEYNIIGRGRGRGKFQPGKSEANSLKCNNEKSKDNSSAQNNMTTWKESEIFEMIVEDCDPTTSTTDKSSQETPNDHDTTDSSCLTLITRTNRIVKKNFDSPIQSPKECGSIINKLRARYSSESSIDSEASSFIVFENDIESQCTDYDDESSSSEELESDDSDDDQLDSKVRFSLKPKIHIMLKWDFAYRAARKGPWEEIARDRERFNCRIKQASTILNPILLFGHRECVYRERFIDLE